MILKTHTSLLLHMFHDQEILATLYHDFHDKKRRQNHDL